MSEAWPPAGQPEDPQDAYILELLDKGLDRYELEQLLGRGGMGEVYLGIHREIEKRVAIKTLAYEHREDPSLNERFLREAKAASKIRNEHVVDITDFGRTPQGCAYFAMEWLEGEDLAETLKREGAIAWPRALAIVLQILDALDAAHRKGVIHRDIKPANCFRTTRGHNPDYIKVLDFGIARSPEEETNALTGTGVILGTAGYIAPEQGRAEPVDARTDIYSLGVMMFEMLSGRRPFRGRTAYELVSKHLTEQPPTLSTIAAQAIPPELDAIVAQCLAKDPAARYPSAAALAEALQGLAGTTLPRSALPSAVMRTAVARTSPDMDSSGSSPGLSGQPAGPTTPASWVGPQSAGMSTLRPPTSPTTGMQEAGAFKPIYAIIVAAVVIGLVAGAFVLRSGGDDAPVAADEPDAPAETPAPSDATPGAAPSACPEGMVRFEGGNFFMGASGDSAILASARPAHKVSVSPYCLDADEVTLTQYRECSRAGECQRAQRDSEWPQGNLEEEEWTRHKDLYSELCNERATGRGDHPVNCITWTQASTYCAFKGKRLPTEAEWEFAARGADGRTFPWGDAPPSEAQANACGIECKQWREKNGLADTGMMFETDDGYVGTAPVGRFPDGATAKGLRDMVGNVFEWTSSDFLPYTETGYGPADGTDEAKVIRGGAFNSGNIDFAKPAMRAPMDPGAHTHGIGVRCAADPSGGAPQE